MSIRRIIICEWMYYPRGGAISNYIQYLSDALVQGNYEVIILSNTNLEYTNEDKFLYRGAKVINIENRSKINLVKRLMNGKLFSIRLIIKLLTLSLKTDDFLIFNQAEYIAKPCFVLKKIIGFKSGGHPLEWFPQSHFRNVEEAKRYEENFRSNGAHDLLFPISHLIEQQFRNTVAKTQLLPIMADTQEYSFTEKENNGVYEFVLPANGAMKDALEGMLLGMVKLTDNEIKKVLFHLRGINKEKVIDVIGKKEWNRIKDSVRFYDWMEYSELVKLYQRSHYLLLARETNQMTEANFPSKVPEVMVYGIVPVVTRVGDYTRYYLENEVSSLIFNGCDASCCVEAIRRAINIPFDRYLEISYKARECAVSKFDYRNWVTIISSAIEKLYNHN